MIKRNIFFKISLFLILFTSVTVIFPLELFAEAHRFWVDTSHWETIPVKRIEQGYWQQTPRQRWIDTSYTVNQGYWKEEQRRRWIDTSYRVTQGYWEHYNYNVWVTSGYYQNYTAQRWIDTSHWETRHRTVIRWVSCNRLFVYQHLPREPYNVILSKWVEQRSPAYTGIINGIRYKYWKSFYYVLPLNNIGQTGAWVHFKTRYHCYEMEARITEPYNVWVTSGYYQNYTAQRWIDTSHWETRTGRRWIDTSYTVTQGYWEYYTENVWVDTSYTVTQGYWEYYTTKDWIDTSYWIYEDIWVEDGYWVEADISLEGMVLHTPQWDKNRISYNLAKTGTDDSPRDYEVFFNGEKFILNASVAGEFEPKSLHVEFVGTGFETELSKFSESKWEGEIWDESFINFNDKDCVFRFTAQYENGIELEDEVKVYIVRDYYWLLHRGF